MRRRVTLIFALATVLTAPLPLALAEPTNQVQYLNIYLKIYEAENLEKQGDYRGALDDFKECYSRLDTLHTNDPNWETALVVQRMRDCKERIAELQTKVDSMPAAGPTNPSPDVPAVSTDTGSDGDLAAMKKQLAEVQEELKVTKGALEDITAKYQNSQIESQTLRSQLAAVNQQLAALNTQQSVDKTTGKLMEDNKALTDKLEQAQAQIKTLSGNPKSSLAKLNVQLKNLQDKLDASDANNTALQQTTTTLQQQLSQAQTDLSVANQKLAETSTGAPEYATIKHENEVMRGILQREIQEQSRRDGAKRLIQEEFDRLKITSKVLQEQFDILGSPMTPPTSDEERALMASLKVPSLQVAPPDSPPSGNVLVAPATPSTDTNAANPTPPAAVTTTDTNTPPAVTSSDTNQPSVTVVTPLPTDTNTPSGTPDTHTAATTGAPPAVTDTNTPPAAPDTNTVATTTTPSSTDTNAPSTTADTNAPTTTTLPPATTTYSDTTIKNNDQSGDPNRYSSKPRIPDDMRDTAQQATDLFKMQRFDEAAAKYQTILDKYPDCLYAWSNLGVVRYQQGSLNDALKALQQAVKLAPNDAFSYRNLGIVYYQLNQNDAAIDALERSIALDPNNAWSHDYLGCACSQKGWEEVAEKEFRKAIEIDETFGEAHSNLAVIYASQKPPSLELARRHYNRALELGIAKDPRLEKLLKQ